MPFQIKALRVGNRCSRAPCLILLLVASVVGGGAFAADTSQEAGYAFAKRLNIVDANRCAGPTAAFVEGCRAYAKASAAKQSFMPNGAYSNGYVGIDPHFYNEPIYSPIRQFE